jgi:hypothetical protein
MTTPTQTPTTAAAFAGWHRPGSRSPWRRVCEAPSYDEALALLMGRTPGTGDLLVSQLDPNDRPADRRRRRY